MTQLELHQIHIDQLFREYVTIEKLQEMTYPPLSRTAIVNAILRNNIDAKRYGDERRGMYIIHLPSARKLWADRFNRV